MSYKNFKTMIDGTGLISEGFSGFLKAAKCMKTIKRIKAEHDYNWYNNYLKTSKDFKEFFVNSCDKDLFLSLPISAFDGVDMDMVRLYLSEIYVSHNVVSNLNKKEGVYDIQLTEAYLDS